MKVEKFNYTATETMHYHCPCCAAEWQTNKLPYCPNCEVKIQYATQSPEPIKICTGCGRLSTDPPIKTPHVGCCPDNNYLPIKKYWALSSFPSNEYEPIREPNTVTKADIDEAFPLETPKFMFKPSEEYNRAQKCRREGAKWAFQQTQAVSELTYAECSERQATHYIIKEPGDSACYPVRQQTQAVGVRKLDHVKLENLYNKYTYRHGYNKGFMGLLNFKAAIRELLNQKK